MNSEGVPDWLAPIGTAIIWILPRKFALDKFGYVRIGCFECNYIMDVLHVCDHECLRHPIVDSLIPINLPIHSYHPKNPTEVW